MLSLKHFVPREKKFVHMTFCPLTILPPKVRQPTHLERFADDKIIIIIILYIYIYIHWRRKRGGGGKGGMCPPHFFDWGGNGMFVPPHF